MFPLAEVSYIIESSFDLLLGGAGLLPRQTCRAHDRVALLFRLSLYIYIYNIDRYFLISIFHRREPWSILLEAMQSRCSGIPWPADVTRSGTQLRSFEKKKSPPVPMSSPAFHSRVFIGLAATGGRNITNGNGKVFYKKETWSASVYIHLRFPFMLFLLSVLEKKKRKEKQNNGKPDDVLHYHSELRSCVISDYIRPLLEVYYNLMLREGAHPQWDCVNSEMARHNITKR